MEKIILKAKVRKTFGRKVKTLRREGALPANLYGKKIKSQALQMSLGDFEKAFEKAGTTGVVELQIGTQTTPTLIRNVQCHPVTDQPLHIDFYKIDLTKKVTATVPINLIGEAPAVEQKIGLLINPLTEIKVQALPKDLPEKIEVDISSLDKIDSAILVKDLKVDTKKVEILTDKGQTVAQIQPPQKEEEEEKPPETGLEPAEGEEAPVEGEEVEEAEARPARPEPGRGKPVESVEGKKVKKEAVEPTKDQPRPQPKPQQPQQKPKSS
jgi:large subunit ribosomal protein L25